jgi:hypothetical protein
MAKLLLDLGPLTERAFVRLGDVELELAEPQAYSLLALGRVQSAWTEYITLWQSQVAALEGPPLTDEQTKEGVAAERASRMRLARSLFPDAEDAVLSRLTQSHVLRIGNAFLVEQGLLIPAGVTQPDPQTEQLPIVEGQIEAPTTER